MLDGAVGRRVGALFGRVLIGGVAALAILASAAGASSSAIDGKYLLSFDACDHAALGNACFQPQNHKVYLAQSDDGAGWQLVPGWTPFAGSVPDVVRRGDTIYVYAHTEPGNGNVVARYRVGSGTIDPLAQVSVSGAVGGDGFVDPSLIVDGDGRLVLFFMPGRAGGDPAMCPTGQSSCTRHFRSATEVDGSDGTKFAVDPGERASVDIGAGAESKTASDPDVFQGSDRFYLLVSEGQSELLLESSTLRGQYTRVGKLDENTGGVGSGYYDSASAAYWTYTHTGSPLVIRRAVTPVLGQIRESDWRVVASGASLGLGANWDVFSPGFAADVAGASAPVPATKKPAPKKKPIPKCKKGQHSTKAHPCRKR